MSNSSTTFGRNRLSENVEAGIDRVRQALSDDRSDTSPTGLQKELFEVLLATDSLLETIDFDKLPESVDIEGLRDRVDLGRLADAIEEHNPDLAFDLSDLEKVIDKRELLNSIDLLEFAKAKRHLDVELEDVLGEDGLPGVSGDSKASADATEFVSSLRSEAKEALIQQEATAKAKAVQETVVEGHAALERRYAANKRRFGDANERRSARNPTAISLLSSGPLPDSASTRHSTVPSKVLYSKADALSRIYSRRWRKTGSERRR